MRDIVLSLVIGLGILMFLYSGSCLLEWLAHQMAVPIGVLQIALGAWIGVSLVVWLCFVIRVKR